MSAGSRLTPSRSRLMMSSRPGSRAELEAETEADALGQLKATVEKLSARKKPKPPTR